MAKPNQPKDIKPQSEEKNSAAPVNSSMGRIIAINMITTILICAIVFVANSITTQKLLTQINNISLSSNEGEQDDSVGEELDRGLIVDMGEFTMNLSDINPRRYLKVNVALEVTKTETDKAAFEAAKAPVASGGHGHGSEPAPIDPMKSIEEEMNQFKPAIRDAIISTLSSKTSDELATIPGKELAKEQIAASVDAIFNGEREVMRVSFGQFIMQ